MALTASGKQSTRNIALDLDMIPWLEKQARRQSVNSTSVIIRQLVRAAMDADKTAAQVRLEPVEAAS